MSDPPPSQGPAEETTPAGPGRFFYGWVVVGVSFFSQFIATGFVFYSFAVVLTSLADEFSGGDRTPIVTLQVVMSVVGVVMAPVIGRLVGRGWIRPLMVAGTVTTGLGLIAIAHARELWQIALIFGTLLAFGAGTMTGLTPTTIVVNWFEKARATALGRSQLGASLGGMVMAPVVAWLVAGQGWRGAYLVLGIATLCAAPVIWGLAVGRPEDRGLRPYGDPEDPTPGSTGTGEAPPPFRTAVALRQPNLWLIALATGIAFMATTALLNHVVAFGTDAGFARSRAALLVSILAGGAALGKLVFGWLSDRIGEPQAFAVSLGSQALGIAALVLVKGYPVTAGVALFTGIGLGGTLPLSSALLARAFGREIFGPMMGLMWPIAIPLQLTGPIIAGWVYDTSGSYRLAFWLFAGMLGVAIVLVRLVRLPASPGPAGTGTER
jgi:MFS family permease